MRRTKWAEYTAEREISTHAPHAGCDCRNNRHVCRPRHFNSRTPCGVRLKNRDLHAGKRRFQLTHPMRGATLGQFFGAVFQFISTHAPHAGCDYHDYFLKNLHRHFNSRTPCGVRRTYNSENFDYMHFNSRTPCGVRPVRQADRKVGRNFNSRTPCGVRQTRTLYQKIYQ